MMKKSYSENEKYAQIPSNIRKIKELKFEYKQLSRIECHKKDPEINYVLIEKYIENANKIPQLNRLYFK